jgi:hypothetical protein
MKTHKRIWILLTIIILLTTVLSGAIWNSHGHSRYEETKINIEEITSSLQTMKNDLKEIKLIKNDLKTQSADFNNGERSVKYYDKNGRELLIEYYDESGHVVKTDYDTNRDGKKDVTEHDLDGDGIPNTIEYDTDGNGKVDVIERDTNKDGIVDVTKIEININGEFVPLGSFGNIIM